MKILDKYLLKSFLVPFFATFLIILFVLVMQALWMAFDSIAGKGIASKDSFLSSIYLAVDIFKRRKVYDQLLQNKLVK